MSNRQGYGLPPNEFWTGDWPVATISPWQPDLPSCTQPIRMMPIETTGPVEVVEVPPPAYGTSSSGGPINVDLPTDPTTGNKPTEEKPSSGSEKTKGELEVLQRNRVLAETGDITSDIEDEEFEDETLVERLIGLTEMFPESVRRTFSSAAKVTFSGIKSTYSLSRSVSWFLASTATLCFLPLFLELERVQTEEQEAVHQRTMMLGPRAAGGGSGLAGFSSAVPHLTPMDSK
ncbi:unnamed protein product [Echinostoma caproni]|uniref:Mitochondrial import receptor subunit TOM22 homolog n=1 Tax=Echinostoma caproni TaxID=27848 RepID=A0A183A1B3_9TREM|nr:unnamed protein product [Echinostoma caproni]